VTSAKQENVFELNTHLVNKTTEGVRGQQNERNA